MGPGEAQPQGPAARAVRYGILFELLLITGLRPGEALALRWSDLDLEAGRLAVRRSLARDGSFLEPKTPRARRTVPLPASTVQALRRTARTSYRSGCSPAGITATRGWCSRRGKGARSPTEPLPDGTSNHCWRRQDCP